MGQEGGTGLEDAPSPGGIAMAAPAGEDPLARMAARLLSTPVAVLHVPSGEADQGGSYGIAAETEETACRAFCARVALAEGPLIEAAGPFRFAAGLPVRGNDASPLGALAVFDRRARSGFGADDLAALADLAGIAAAALDARAPRRSAAARAASSALADRLKTLAVEALGYEAAVQATLQAVCEATGGVLCTLHRLGADGVALQLVGGFADPAIGGAARLEAVRRAALSVSDGLLGAAIAGGRQCLVRLAEGAPPHGALGGKVAGAHVLVATPVRIAEERCALFLACPAPGTDLPGLMQDAAATLRPLLQMLRDEERMVLHRRVVESSSEAVLITEAAPGDGRIVHVNPAFESLTGFGAEELVGRAPGLLQGLGAPGADWRAIREALGQRRQLRQEALFRRKDGTPVWVDLHIAPVADPAGRITHLVTMVRDITREHEAKLRLAESEAAFRSLFEQNPLPMWIHDRATLAFLSVNDAAVEDYGWPREEFLRMSMLDICPAHERDAAHQAAEQLGMRRGASGPWRHVTRAGHEKIVEINAHLTDFAGRPAVLVAALDVTARHRFERDLRLSRAALQRQAVELRQTQRLARLGTWRWDAEQGEISWSEEVHAIIGTDPNGPAPTRGAALAMVLPEDRHTLTQAVARIVRTGQPGAFEFRVRRPDGRLVHCRAEARWEADPDGGPESVLGYIQDVTEQREAEATLRQADRLNSLGQVTGGIAHDFNNLLTVASVSLEMAADEAREGRTAPDLIEAARGALERGMRLTSQLLSYARRQPLRPEAIDLGKLLPGLVDLMQRTLGERYQIRLSLGATPMVAADPAQLEAALLNLLVNARDAMPAGGQIEVGTRLARAEETGHEAELPPGHYAVITVTDSGVGMPPEIKARIFEPFFTTKSPGLGTGLGLSMVMGFAKQSGGHVAVASQPGQGTTFTLYLPMEGDAAQPGVAGRGGEAVAPLPQGLDVLVVEDQPDVRRAAVRLCRQVGLQPVAVQGAAEALELLDSGFRFDLLFTDVVLGSDIDGLQLAEAATKLQPNLAVVCTSGYAEQQVENPPHAGLEMLAKPYDIRRFREAVGRALAAAAARQVTPQVE